MGRAKELIFEQIEQADIAEEIAVEAKVLKRCPWHGNAYQDDFDLTAAYMLGNKKFSRNDLRGVFATRREMTDTIKQIVDSAPWDCLSCEHLRGRV
jgi:hypothetical protein